MTAKTRKALLYIFMSLFILTMFTASLTFGRYSSEQSSDSHYSGDFEYVLSDAIVVNSIDEFFDAINNGYSNIQIGDEVDNPLIITGDTGNVWADLTIDLNGHELQRNDRDPLLNVSEGFRLTIIDSKGGGSLYNPVGSVLRSSGGTITVTDGIMESGPRNGNRSDETASSIIDNNGTSIDSKTKLDEYATDGVSETGGRFAATNNNVTYYEKTKNNEGIETYPETGSTRSMPIIIPTKITRQWTTDGQTITQNALNGNMYLESGYSSYFDPDTYLYYTIEGTGVSNEGIAASTTSADFYYTYYVNSSDYGYVSAPQDDDLLVTVYGYNGVKDGSQNSAAIEATGGEVLVRGGTYYSYFGKENTYCINANSGYMSVDSSSAISFYAYGNGVCVQCNYSTDNLQISAGDADLRITNGNFYSELGNTISVTNGVMEIGTATFTKDAGTTSASGHTANGSAISVEGGGLKITSSATFNITGSGIDGIHAEATSFDANASALVDVASVNMTFNSDTSSAHSDNRGIYSKNGAISCTGTTNVTLNGGSGSTDNFGIYTLGGQITVKGDTTVSVSGEDSNGVYSTVEKGTTSAEVTAGAGRISITGNTFTCTVKMNNVANLSSTAISTAGGNINFNVGSAVIDSDGLGITALNMPINSKGEPDTTTVISNAGNIAFDYLKTDENSNSIALKTPRGTGVYIYGGGVTIAEGITFDVTSDITAGGITSTGYGWQSNDEAPTSYDGIYISGGSLNSQGTLKVTHTGVQNDNYDEFDDLVVKSYAIRIEAAEGVAANSTQVTITKGNIVNQVTYDSSGNEIGGGGGGVYVSGSPAVDSDGNIMTDEDDNTLYTAKVSLGVSGTSNTLLTVNSTGTLLRDNGDINNGMFEANDNNTWDYKKSLSGGPAIEVTGGQLTIESGIFSAEQGNGITVRNGIAIINAGQFTGNDTYVNNNNYYTIDGQWPWEDDTIVYRAPAGAAASYAFKIFGGTAEINGGDFGGSGGGAFAMGTSSSQEATVNMYSGTIAVTGSTGFSVWTNATLTFGELGENGPTISAESTGLAIETTSSGNGSTITINSGTFMSTNVDENNKNGIWRGGTESVLTIKGGTFVGSYGNGLNSAEANCKIDGGEFYGRGFNSHWEGSTWVGAYSAAPISYMNNPGNYNNNIYVINGEEYNFNYLHIQ